MRTSIVVGATVAVLAVILLLGAGDDAGPNAFVVIGIATGAIYGLVAIGLVLIYKGSRVFNFAQGEFGTMAAFIVYVLVEQVKSVEIPYGVAVLVALLVAVAIGLIMERLIVRPLMNGPKITLLVATIAFALFLVGVQLLLFHPEAKALSPALESQTSQGEFLGVTIFGYNLEPQNILIIAVLGGLAVLLGYFFSRTDLGLAILATSQDAFATRVVGIGVERMSRVIWGSAAFLGGVAGILYMPISGALTPGGMTTGILIPGFTAAVLGGMTSLPGAFLGGIVVGCVQSLANWAGFNWHITTGDGAEALQSIIPGLPDVALIVVLLVVLLI
ncbi:MAG: branched-chain amino acid ABC transporter permease, partial [Actinomycetota bacterium]